MALKETTIKELKTYIQATSAALQDIADECFIRQTSHPRVKAALASAEKVLIVLDDENEQAKPAPGAGGAQ